MGSSDPQKPDNNVELRELLRRSAAGDAHAFRRVVDGHRQYAFALAFRLLCDEEEARDVAQEAFIRVWRHLPEYEERAKFTTWLYAIVTNLAYDRLRREKRNPRASRLGELPPSREPAAAPTLEEGVSNRDLAAMIRKLSDGLPPKQRMIFVLRDLEDLPLEEISSVLGLSAGTVRTNLCYARRAIRERIQRLPSGGG